MANNPNQTPRPKRSPNQTPAQASEILATPFDDYVEGRYRPEQMRDMDPASQVVEVADYVQRSLYEIDPGVNQEAMFEPGQSMPGYETLLVANEMRKQGRNELLPSEKVLMNHMKLIGDNYQAQARLDFEAIAEAHPGLNPVETQLAAAKEMIDEIKTQRDASADESEKRMLTMKIQTLTKYASMVENPDSVAMEDEKLYGKMLQADYRAQQATGDKKQGYQDEVKDYSKQVKEINKSILTATGVYSILAEKYSKEPPRNGDDMPVDPRLVYESPEQAAERQAAVAQEQAQRKAAEAAQQQMEAAELAGLREQIASSGTLSEVFQAKNMDNIRTRYRELCTNQAMHKYGDILNNPHVDAKTKSFYATKAVIEEQTALRALKNEKLKDTKLAKVCRWVGRHKLIVMGTSVVFAPLTGGMSLAAGVAMGGGIIAGASIDNKVRGSIRSADKAINPALFINEAQKEMAKRAADRRLPAVEYADFHKWGMDSYEKDMYKERIKRLGAVALGGAIGLFGQGLLPSTGGADMWLWNNAATLKPWVYYGGGAAALIKHKKLK